MSKKMLVVLTNTAKYPTLKRATGLWLGEAVHFVEKVEKAGYMVDYVSPEGAMSLSTHTACRWPPTWTGNGMTTSAS